MTIIKIAEVVTNTVVDFPALLNTKILNLAVNTAYIVQFDIKRVGNDGAGKPFDVQIRTTPPGAGTRLPWFVNVVNGDPLYDRVLQGDITTTFSTKKARFTTPGTIDTNETYYLTLVKNQAAWGSTTDKYVVDNVSISAEVTWTGASSADWSTAGNWDTGALPTEFDYVTIPTGTGNNPTISATTAAVANNITTNDVLTIASGGSLIVGGTSTGNVTYNRNLTFTAGNSEGWHLVGSPVVGQAYNNAYADDNNIATSGTKRGIAPYDNSVTSNNWDYLESDDSNSGDFNTAQGYSLKTTATTDVSFIRYIKYRRCRIKQLLLVQGLLLT